MSYGHVALGFIMKEPENKQCMDCGAQNPTFASINNGVVLCEKCAVVHHNLGNSSVSFIKSLTNEQWSDDEVMYLQVSGNKRMWALLKEFEINYFQPIDYKYLTMAANYHRQSIAAELSNQQKPIKPNVQTGQMTISQYTQSINQPKQQKTGLFGKMESLFTEVKDNLNRGANELDKKFNISGNTVKALQWTQEKSKEISENPTVKDLTKKTEEGFNKVVDVTKKTLGIGQNQQGQNNQVQQNNQHTFNPNQNNQNFQHQDFTTQNQNNQQLYNAPPNEGGNQQENMYPTFHQNQNYPKQG
jgi:uncharacterized membrane-anchored protein YhcB (DUF1043 family)